jgi:hypothetical protein
MASRDGRITVRVVMRYLANKLGLEDDSQVCHARLIFLVLFVYSLRSEISVGDLFPIGGSSSSLIFNCFLRTLLCS